MTLKEYLILNEIPVMQAAKRLQITRKHLSNIMYGRGFPGRHLAKVIELFTKGNIKAETLMKPRKEHE